MKIYNRKSFRLGIVFLCVLLLYMLRIVKADPLHWILSIALAVKFLSSGLSKSGNKRQENMEKNYNRVSQELFGKYVGIKTNLPWIIAVGFFAVTLFIRCVFDVTTPVWAAVCFAIVLTISVFYSIGLEAKIKEYMDEGIPR